MIGLTNAVADGNAKYPITVSSLGNFIDGIMVTDSASAGEIVYVTGRWSGPSVTGQIFDITATSGSGVEIPTLETSAAQARIPASEAYFYFVMPNDSVKISGK